MLAIARRTRRFIAVLALLNTVCLSHAEDGQDQKASEPYSGPTEAEVLQVFSAEDDGHRFIAYVVEWNGHRVIVSDPLARSQAQVGDSIRFLVHRHSVGRGDREQALLAFVFLESPTGLDLELPVRSREEEQRSMKLVRGDLSVAENDEERFIALGDAARNAYEAGDVELARKLAEELAQKTPNYRRSWNYGNAVQDYNQVLGRIALAAGDIDEAKRRLLASADSKGSPQMNSFGPNMLLAKELLAEGERDVVLQYFDACETFWELGDDELAEWREAVGAGEIPAFGANLNY